MLFNELYDEQKIELFNQFIEDGKSSYYFTKIYDNSNEVLASFKHSQDLKDLIEIIQKSNNYSLYDTWFIFDLSSCNLISFSSFEELVTQIDHLELFIEDLNYYIRESVYGLEIQDFIKEYNEFIKDYNEDYTWYHQGIFTNNTLGLQEFSKSTLDVDSYKIQDIKPHHKYIIYLENIDKFQSFNDLGDVIEYINLNDFNQSYKEVK